MLGVLDAVLDNKAEEDAVDPDPAREGVVHGGEQVAHPRDGEVQAEEEEVPGLGDVISQRRGVHVNDRAAALDRRDRAKPL